MKKHQLPPEPAVDPGAFDAAAAMDAVAATTEVFAGMLSQLQGAGYTRDEAASIVVASQAQMAAHAQVEAANAMAAAATAQRRWF